ncbi:MAG TPA: BsuPI-related putative proteinase inhibitor, partial [Mycobacteriales bacterium]|nr:BsuPI-related putative proteinase inhibitor [Mycobacteriales bacterium]
MRDLDLLPRRPFALLPPEPGGFEEALARGRRRRRRNTGGGVLASIVAIALATSLAGSSPDTDATLFTKLPDAGISQVERDRRTVAVDPDDEVADEIDEVAQPGVDDSGTTSAGARREFTGDATAANPPTTTTTRRNPPARSTKRTLPDPRTQTIDKGHATCAASDRGLRVTEYWCLQVIRVVSQSDPVDSELQFQVCASLNAPATSLNHRDSKAVDFVVTKQGSAEELWRWSYGAVPKPKPRVDQIANGDCVQYSVDWKGRVDNNNNFISEAGTYVLTATSFARELGSTNEATA